VARPQPLSIVSTAPRSGTNALAPFEGCYCPHTKGTRTAFIRPSQLEAVKRYYPAHKLHELAELVPTVLRDPKKVWRGIREPDPGNDLPGYCFSRRLPQKVDNLGQKFSAPLGQCFSVYMNSEFVIYEWGWDECENHDEDCPKKAADRFWEPLR
jgi:hypothetical protein